jgi:hypothetical protein
MLLHQLLLPMALALAGGGDFVTMPATQHFESHAEIIKMFLSRRVVTENSGNLVDVRVTQEKRDAARRRKIVRHELRERGLKSELLLGLQGRSRA